MNQHLLLTFVMFLESRGHRIGLARDGLEIVQAGCDKCGRVYEMGINRNPISHEVNLRQYKSCEET